MNSKFREHFFPFNNWQGKFFLLMVLLSLAGIGHFSPLVEKAEFFIQDVSERFWSRFRSSTGHVVLVEVDDSTLASMKEKWPLPRAKTAALIQKLNQFAPKLIVPDMLFQHAQPGPNDPLASSFAEKGNVVLLYILEQTLTPSGTTLQKFRSYRSLREKSVFEGFVWGFFDPDQTIRTFVLADGRLGEESCSLKIARRINPSVYVPGPTKDLLRRSFFSFSRGFNPIKVFSAKALQENSIPPGELKDKVVVLGCTATSGMDWHSTSLGRISGSYILATSIDTIIAGRSFGPWRFPELHFLFSLFAGVLGFWFSCQFSEKWLVQVLFPFCVVLFSLFLSRFLGTFLPVGSLLLGCLGGMAYAGILRAALDFFRSEQFEQDSENAEFIQKKMFPKFPWKEADFECVGFCQPCERAGGDYYDFIQLSREKFLFLVGDVTGHGYGAAIVTTILKGVISQLAKRFHDSPLSLVFPLNRFLLGFVKKELFATLILGILNPKQNTALVASCGHIYGLLRKKEGLQEIGLPGTPLGFTPKRFEKMVREVKVDFSPGDSLLFFSDGVYEVIDKDENQYGLSRFQELVGAIPRHHGPKEIISEILSQINLFKGDRPFDDDVTIVVLKKHETEA